MKMPVLRGRAKHHAVHGNVFLALAGVLYLMLVACRSSRSILPPKPRLTTVELAEDESTGTRQIGAIDVAAIAADLVRILGASGLVEIRAGDGGASGDVPPASILRVVGRVGVEFTDVGDKGIARAGVGLRILTRPSDLPGAINEEISAASEQPYAIKPDLDRRRIGQQLVARTAADLVSGVVARIRLTTAAPADLHAVMIGDGGALREEAIRVAGARGLRTEIPTLLAFLQNDDETIRDAALGALIVLREPRAVTALTRNRSLRDRREMRKILEAIATLGGQEAIDYLGFVAESHDDEEIRTLAAEAKSRLERRSRPRPP
jgi:hypothetical protein